MFVIRVELAPEDRVRVDRILDYLDNRSQAEIDSATAMLKATNDSLEATLNRPKEK